MTTPSSGPADRSRRVGALVDRPPPLYDPSTEHDACGVGFVADSGGRSADRVLPLALAGLAALGHRGAFGADGRSSDGAGIAIPLTSAVLERLTSLTSRTDLARLGPRPGILQLFLPRHPVDRRRARSIVDSALAEVALEAPARRRVPSDLEALGPVARASAPAFEQILVARPIGPGGRPVPDATFERRLGLVRRRIVRAAHAGGPRLRDVAVASASCRIVVYKGLVSGDRLGQLFPDLAGPLAVPFATFHQRYATNTHPTWALAQPFGRIAHNGEIDTIRANREEVRGRAADPDPRGYLREVLVRGPLLDPAGSDSASLDEVLELLVATGWDLADALATLIPAAPALRSSGAAVPVASPRPGGLLAPWDGPAAVVFTDGRTVGALLDRNGLRPLAFAIERDGLVAAASEAGAIPIDPSAVVRLDRLGPGELLVVDPVLRRIETDGDIRRRLRTRSGVTADLDDRPWSGHRPPALGTVIDTGRADRPTGTGVLEAADTIGLRYLAGLDAERLRLDIRTMTLEGREPLWSMGDDTPIPSLARVPRRLVDHLKQTFAQVTNPPIDPDRERLVVDLGVHVGRRAPLLGGPSGRRHVVKVPSPILTDLDALRAALDDLGAGPVIEIDATWAADDGVDGLVDAVDRIAAEAIHASRHRAVAVVVSDRRIGLDRVPVPSALAIGAAHAALVAAGRRGRTDIVAEAADVLDTHACAMVLATGARAVHPWLALRLAADLSETRGAEVLDVAQARANLAGALEGGIRKTIARMGISTVASYIGGALFESVDLADEVHDRCFPAALRWGGGVGFRELAERQLARRRVSTSLDEVGFGPDDRGPRLPDPGFTRFRSDGEEHQFAPRVVRAIQGIATGGTEDPAGMAAYRAALAPAVASTARDLLAVRPSVHRRRIGLAAVESVEAITRRFVVSAMSVGALSPEAHQVLTLGIQRAGGSANTGEGGEDPRWYVAGTDGERRDAHIKQVASGRFGVTAEYLVRAEQLEIKIAQGSKPGEGGQLPARKATAYIAGLRRGQSGQAYISPPPHHDIYSIEDLAQLIADLRAINPGSRIGVKLVASRGIGTIAAGVAKAGATYIHVAGGSGGTGASPLSSIKHVGVSWELGLAEAHQVLLWNDLRDRVALRTDGGLRRGRDLLVAALLGAEEFAIGTAALVAIGCDMARQCHLDTCPTGIATQRPDLRARFAGTPDQVVRFARALAEDLRAELAAIGARSVGEIVGESARILRPAPGVTDGARSALVSLVSAPRWSAGEERRAQPRAAGRSVPRAPASQLESRLIAAFRGHRSVALEGIRMTTAERSFGAGLTGELERGALHAPMTIGTVGSAGQSFGAFLGAGFTLRIDGTANDYVGKGLSGGTVIVAPDRSLERSSDPAPLVAGNTCLYGATAGRLHVLGRAGMRFGVRNAGAEATVEGVGPHGAEYMTGGTIVVLGPIGSNFGAGMTGGRAYVLDPNEQARSLIDASSVTIRRLRPDDEADTEKVATLARLIGHHRDAGSPLAAAIEVGWPDAVHRFVAVEPLAASPAADHVVPIAPTVVHGTSRRVGSTALRSTGRIRTAT